MFCYKDEGLFWGGKSPKKRTLRAPLLRVSCFRKLINVCQFRVIEDRSDSLQGICLPDPFQLDLNENKPTRMGNECEPARARPGRLSELHSQALGTGYGLQRNLNDAQGIFCWSVDLQNC